MQYDKNAYTKWQANLKAKKLNVRPTHDTFIDSILQLNNIKKPDTACLNDDPFMALNLTGQT